jgi:uncharacterized short protein YbdD (DUF466 family)
MNHATHGHPLAEATTLAATPHDDDATAHAPSAWLARTLARIIPVVRRVIGVPDYEIYCQHMAVSHPSQPPLSERDFAEERLAAKYSRPGQRCC